MLLISLLGANIMLTGLGEVPPVVRAEGVVGELRKDVIESLRVLAEVCKEKDNLVSAYAYRVALLVMVMLVTGNVDLQMVLVLNAVGASPWQAGRRRGKRVLNVRPVDALVSRVLGEEYL